MVATEIILMIPGLVYIICKTHEQFPGMLIQTVIIVAVSMTLYILPFQLWTWIARNISYNIGIPLLIIQTIVSPVFVILLLFAPDTVTPRFVKKAMEEKRKADKQASDEAWAEVRRMPPPSESEIMAYAKYMRIDPIFMNERNRKMITGMIEYERYKQLLGTKTRCTNRPRDRGG